MLTLRQHILRELIVSGAVGGPAVADSFGVSRMSVSKAVGSLRQDGFVIDARPGAGYQLVALPSALVPDEVGARIESPFWESISGAVEVHSTNDLALEAGRAGALGPAAFAAGSQTAGRGRLGRTWRSPIGGVYLSILVRPPVDPTLVGSLSLVTALAVADVAAQAGIGPLVKWPNDVWADGEKLAGVLLESQVSTDGIDFVVVGIGVNPLGTARPAEVAAALLDRFSVRYERWLENGFAPFVEEFNRIELNSDAAVTVRNRGGDVIADGTVRGVDVHGRLLLEQPDGSVVPVSSGEVTLRS